MSGTTPEVLITRVYERGACYFVEGVVEAPGQWKKAAFTVHKPDVHHMSREQFREFALRQLPKVTEDIDWSNAM